MEYLLMQLVNGVSQGAIYALMAIGYATIVGVTGIVTSAQGEVIMIGAYAAFYAFTIFSANLFAGIIASFFVSWAIGMIIYKTCYERFLDSPRVIPLICTIGFSMIARNLAQIIFGANIKHMPQPIDLKFVNILGVRINSIQILIVVTVILLSIILYIMNSKTKTGLKLRAVSQDRNAAALMGININKMILLGSCLGCGIGGIAGMLMGVYYQSIVPIMGAPMGMKSLVASVLGGLTSVPASAFGGLLIGVIENLGISILSNSYRDVFAFVFLIAILVVFPEGIAKKVGGKI